MLKYIIASILLFLIPISAGNVHDANEGAEYTILHINAKWNERNNLVFDRIPNCKTQYAFLEEQSEEIRKSIQYVPHVVLLKKNKPIAQWSADLSFKLNLTSSQIKKVIESH